MDDEFLCANCKRWVTEVCVVARKKLLDKVEVIEHERMCPACAALFNKEVSDLCKEYYDNLRKNKGGDE